MYTRNDKPITRPLHLTVKALFDLRARLAAADVVTEIIHTSTWVYEDQDDVQKTAIAYASTGIIVFWLVVVAVE